MKRGFIFLFIIFAYFSLALQIEIISPEDDLTINGTEVTFICNVSQSFDGETIANLSLYHNLDGGLSLEQTVTSGITLGESYSFNTEEDVDQGGYQWFCDASNDSGGYVRTLAKSFTLLPGGDGGDSNGTNQAPVISKYSPTTLNFTLSLNTSTRFAVNASDPNNDTLTVQWSVDGSIKASDDELWEFGYTPRVSGVNLTVRARVSDGSLFTDVNWTIRVPFVNTTTDEEDDDTTTQDQSSTTTDQTTTTSQQSDTNTTQTSVCGDGIEDIEEDCDNCPEDAGCPEGYNCKEGSCISIEESNNLFLIILVIASFIIFAIVFSILYKKYKKGQIFPKDEELLQEELPGEEKPTEEAPGVKEEKPKVEEQKQPKKVLNKSNLAILRNYIDESLKRGKDFNFIKDKLLKVGWTEEQVSQAIMSFKNERTGKVQGNKKTSQ